MPFLKSQTLALILLSVVILAGFQKTRAQDTPLSPIEKKTWPVLAYYEQFKNNDDVWDKITDELNKNNTGKKLTVDDAMERYADALIEFNEQRHTVTEKQPFAKDYEKFRFIITSPEQLLTGDYYFLNDENLFDEYQKIKTMRNKHIKRIIVSIEQHKEKIKVQKSFLELATDSLTRNYFSPLQRAIIQIRVAHTEQTGRLITYEELRNNPQIISLLDSTTEQPIPIRKMERIWRTILLTIRDLPETIRYERELFNRIQNDPQLTIQQRGFLKEMLTTMKNGKRPNYFNILDIAPKFGISNKEGRELFRRYPQYNPDAIIEAITRYPNYFHENALQNHLDNDPSDSVKTKQKQILADFKALEAKLAYDRMVYKNFQEYWYDIPLETRVLIELRYGQDGSTIREWSEIVTIIKGEKLTGVIMEQERGRLTTRVSGAKQSIEDKIKSGIPPTRPRESVHGTPSDVFGSTKDAETRGFSIKGSKNYVPPRRPPMRGR